MGNVECHKQGKMVGRLIYKLNVIINNAAILLLTLSRKMLAIIVNLQYLYAPISK